MRSLPTIVAARRLVFLLALFGWSGSAAPARDAWVKVATPELTVVTTLGAREASRWAGEFTQYIAALRGFFNDSRVELPALTIVIFAREQDFERYLPLRTPGGKPQPVGGFFVRHEAWAVVGMPARVSEDTRRTIFHEGVHWFLSASKTRNPIWLEEGLAEVFSTFHSGKDEAEWGRAIENHVYLLRSVPPLPLEKLLHTAPGEVFGDDRMRTGLVYAQSWAFVHFLMFGKHDIPRDGIGRYLEAVSAGTTPDEAFRTVFRRSLTEMDRLLRAYVTAGEYYLGKQALNARAAPAALPATTADVETALGRLAIAGKRPAQAMAHAGAAMAAAPDDPRGHELLALALQATGDRAGALAEYQAAIVRGSRDFQPYFEVAAATQQAATEARGRMTPAEARTVANHYERAIGYYPRFLGTYENLAGVIGSAEPVGPEDRAFLELGQRLFPESGIIPLGLAQLARREGDAGGARRILDRVRANPAGLTPEGAAFARKLDLAWRQEDTIRRVDELGRAGQINEALELLDSWLAANPDEGMRRQLSPYREQLGVAQLSQQVKAALDGHRWVEARKAIARLLASAAPESAKAQARRVLAELDAQKLGLEVR